MSEPQDNSIDPDDLKKVLTGYQMAISLWTYQGGQVWARFNVLLVANGMIIAAIAMGLTSTSPPPILIELLPVIGAILCVFWILLMKRESKYADYYINSAHELEKKYLAPVETVCRGALLAKGKKVTLKIGNERESFQMSPLASFFTAKNISYLIIFLFLFLYTVILLL